VLPRSSENVCVEICLVFRADACPFFFESVRHSALVLVRAVRFSRKPFNPQPLISHLTNSNGCGNLQTKVLLIVSPLGTLLLPQPRVYSQPSDFSGQSRNVCHAVSYSCGLFAALCAVLRARFVCFQQLAASFCKIPGGVGCLCDSSAYSAPLHPACPDLRGEPRRARYSLPLFLSPRCAALLRELTQPFSRRSPCPLSTFRINTCKNVSKQMTLSPFRINTGSVDILPDEGMPQAIEVVGKTEQQGLANLYR